MSDSTDLSRRQLLSTLVTAGAVAPLVACSDRTAKRLVPYVLPPDDLAPGESRHYRTICRECSAGCGLSVRTREGRAVKLEGNPEHPISKGALCPRGQAGIESLYDVDRLRAPMVRRGAGHEAVSWEAADAALLAAIKQATSTGKRVAVLTRPERGSLGSLFASWLTAIGQSADQVVTFDPSEPGWLRAGARHAFGAEGEPIYEIGRARMLLSIGADFLEGFGSPIEHARALSEMRAQTRAQGGRFIYVGPRMSLTAASADEWLSVRPGTELSLVLCLAHLALQQEARGLASLPSSTIDRLRASLAPFDPISVAAKTGLAEREIVMLAQDFTRNRPSLCVGPGFSIAGEDAVALATAVNVLNAIAGNVGETMHFLEADKAPEPKSNAWSLDELVKRMEAGEIGALLVHHADPVGYGAPLARFRDAMAKVPAVVAFANRLDETGKGAHLVLADHHPLESWGRLEERPGVIGLQQATMRPLHDTRATGDVLLAHARANATTQGLPDVAFAKHARTGAISDDLERGGIFRAAAKRAVQLVEDPFVGLTLAGGGTPGADSVALVLFPLLRHLGARRSESELLQEIPDGLTGIAWNGWIEMHPDTATSMRMVAGDVVRLTSGSGSTVELPVFVTPGMRKDAIAAPVAYAGNFARLTPEGLLGAMERVRVAPTGRKVVIKHLVGMQSQHGRELAREVKASHAVLAVEPRKRLSLYPEHKHQKHRWGMTIDLDRCNGCTACVAACYVENNIPVVGAEQVALGREMSWIRIEHFLEGPKERPRAAFLPVMCQQCCNAPCESVCPSYAAYHHPEGVNAMVYNRCVGTRYCENNCPYKARRYNWNDHPHPEPTNLGLNPDVTVRERGVTEKCTFCFQRIREAEEHAKLEGRPVREGEITPACAQTCAASAIVFGDLNDPSSRVSRLAADPRGYQLLDHLNAEPGVHYLARIDEDRR